MAAPTTPPSGETAELLDIDALAAAFESLPAQGLPPAVAALAMGVLLWWFGERLLRLALMMVAVFVGVPLGLMLGAALAPALPPLAAAIVGALVLLIAAAVGLKFAVAGGLAVVLGLASLLGTILAVEQGWVEIGETIDAAATVLPDRGVAVVAFTQPAPPAPPSPPPASVATGADDEGPSAWADLIESMLHAREWASARWNGLPAAGRTLAGAAGAVGLVLGFGLGMIFQRLALRVATAVLGSLLILSGATTLLGWLAPEWVARTLPGGPWLGLWGVLSATGAIVQWKRSAADADEE